MELKKYIEKRSYFFKYPFSRKAVDRLIKFKVKAFKIGSGECNNYPLIDYIASFKKPIIISTGMNDIKSIQKAIKILKKRKTQFAILHTTNLYPTRHSEVRLNALIELKKKFTNTVIGLSDHTGDNYTSYAAIAMGASIIEKHFIDKSSRKGPDISASVNTKQMKELIKGVNLIHKAIPGGIKPIPREKKTANFAFASVVANKDLEIGTILNKNILGEKTWKWNFKAEEYYSLIGKMQSKSKRTHKLKNLFLIKLNEKNNNFFFCQ